MTRRSLVPVLGLVGLALGTPVNAQVAARPDWNRSAYTDDAVQPYGEARRIAYDNGYREGLREGERDGRRREPFNYQDERTWQRADKGYNRSFGDWSRYQVSFRSGYSTGYTEAYRRFAPNYGYGRNDGYGNGGYGNGGYGNGGYGNGGYGGAYPNTRGGYGSGGGYYSPAFSNGANDGYEKGREDARDRHAYDPLRHKWYRSGDHDYKSQYGSRQQYENAYRQGFKDGYERGYREFSYRR